MDYEGFDELEASLPGFGELEAELRAAFGEPPSELTEARHLRQISAVFRDHGRWTRTLARVAAVAAVVAVLGSGGAAVAGALPGPIQHVAHEIGRVVRIPVPPTATTAAVPDPTLEELNEALRLSLERRIAAQEAAAAELPTEPEAPAEAVEPDVVEESPPLPAAPAPAPAPPTPSITWSGALCDGAEVAITVTADGRRPRVDVDGPEGSVDIDGGRIVVRFAAGRVTLRPEQGALVGTVSGCDSERRDDSQWERDGRYERTWGRDDRDGRSGWDSQRGDDGDGDGRGFGGGDRQAGDRNGRGGGR